jgi:hypothetical protein
MNESQWTQIDVARANNLREKKAKLEEQIAALEAEREPLSGSEKGAVTRQITPLENEVAEIDEELKNLPPAPMHPDDAADALTSTIQRQLNEIATARQEMIDKITKGRIESALTWEAESVFKSRLFEIDLDAVLEGAEAENAPNAFRGMQAAIETIFNANDEKLKRMHSIGGSSNELATLCEKWEVEYRLERFRRSDDLRYIAAEARYIEKKVAAWEALNEQTLGDFIEEDDNT